MEALFIKNCYIQRILEHIMILEKILKCVIRFIPTKKKSENFYDELLGSGFLRYKARTYKTFCPRMSSQTSSSKRKPGASKCVSFDSRAGPKCITHCRFYLQTPSYTRSYTYECMQLQGRDCFVKAASEKLAQIKAKRVCACRGARRGKRQWADSEIKK